MASGIGGPAVKIMTLNCGSSSVKYSVWDTTPSRKIRLCEGIVERVGVKGGFIRHQRPGMPDLVRNTDCPNHTVALREVVDTVISGEWGVIGSVAELSAVAHRIVHGGEKFRRSVLIDDDVVNTVKQYSILAPLHNPPNLLGVETMRRLVPRVPHIAVFDTAFFSTMPAFVYTYAVPHEWYEKYGVRKYGFHGTSHLYVSRRAAAMLGRPSRSLNLITLHIGSGASVAAIKDGAGFDISLGFSTLPGLTMGTRGGDLDPGILLYMMERAGLTVQQLSSALYKQSGILGITGCCADRRDVLKLVEKGDPRAQLALDVECYNARKYVGAYAAALGVLDAIVFTAGVGENSPVHRARICEGLGILGVSLDPVRNAAARRSGGEADISAAGARVRTLVIPTNEELVFVEDAEAILSGAYASHTEFSYSFEKADFTPA
jgi:acetate kinase